MKKTFFYNAITYFVALIGGSLVNLLTCGMAVKIVNLFIVVDFFASVVVSIIVSFVTTCGVFAALGYYEGYKRAEFSVGMNIGEIAAAGGVQLVLSVPFMFHPFIAGGTKYLAGIVELGSRFDSMQSVLYIWSYLLAFVIYLAVQIIVCVISGIIGKNKRIAQRRALTEQN